MKETYRDRRGIPFLETLVQDTRYALRRLRKAPAFTITTVLTLALGIGATTSIFTLAYAVILKSLAVAKPGELYRLGKHTAAATTPVTVRRMSSPWSLTICTNTSETTPKVSRNSPHSSHRCRCLVSGVQTMQRRHKAIQVSSFQAITSLCSVSTPMPDERLPHVTIRPCAASRGNELSPMAANVWIGSIRYRQCLHIDEKPFTVVGITPPGFFGDTLRSTSARFLSAAEHGTLCRSRRRSE